KSFQVETAAIAGGLPPDFQLDPLEDLSAYARLRLRLKGRDPGPPAALFAPEQDRVQLAADYRALRQLVIEQQVVHFRPRQQRRAVPPGSRINCRGACGASSGSTGSTEAIVMPSGSSIFRSKPASVECTTMELSLTKIVSSTTSWRRSTRFIAALRKLATVSA